MFGVRIADRPLCVDWSTLCERRNYGTEIHSHVLFMFLCKRANDSNGILAEQQGNFLPLYHLSIPLPFSLHCSPQMCVIYSTRAENNYHHISFAVARCAECGQRTCENKRLSFIASFRVVKCPPAGIERKNEHRPNEWPRVRMFSTYFHSRSRMLM